MSGNPTGLYHTQHSSAQRTSSNSHKMHAQTVQ